MGHRSRLRHEGTVGRTRVFGLADWHRDGTLAEYVAIEARNLAPLPGVVDSRWARACQSGPHRVAGTIPARPSSGGAERPRARRGRRSRVDGDAADVRPAATSSAPDALPTVRRRSPSAPGVRRPRQRRAGSRRRRRSGVRCHRRRHPVLRRPDPSRRNAGVHRRADRGGPADGLAIDSLSTPIVPN